MRQAHNSVSQIRRISANQENALIQAEILPILDSILFVKVEKNYCMIFRQFEQRVKEDIVRIPFKQLLFFLERDQLVQVHRSYAVNPNKLERVSEAKLLVHLQSEQQVLVAKKYLKELQHHYPEAFRH